jgi:hypothetical protein
MRRSIKKGGDGEVLRVTDLLPSHGCEVVQGDGVGVLLSGRGPRGSAHLRSGGDRRFFAFRSA